MKVSNRAALWILVVALSERTTDAFSSTTKDGSFGRYLKKSSSLSDTRVLFPEETSSEDASDVVAKKEPTVRRRSGMTISDILPFVPTPPLLAESDLAGNFGFDPLGLASSEGKLLRYREIEIKHGRLAMLVAAGLFVSGLLDGTVELFVGIPLTLEQLELEQFHTVFSALSNIPQFWGFCVGLTAASDMYGLAKAESGDPEYFPGNLGFDPLGLYPEDKDDQKSMQCAEVKHGRVAMLAVAYLVFDTIVSFVQ